jgi:acetyl esterase/lipase
MTRTSFAKLLDQLLPAIAIFMLPGGPMAAQSPAWQPPPWRVQLQLWPGTVPHAVKTQTPEDTTLLTTHFVAGRPWAFIEKVARPTIAVYPPRERSTGAAVVVFPGGGYHILAIDLEGTEVCEWLTSRGSCRPDFAVVIYPGHLLEHTSRPFQLNPYVPVTQATPPTFLVQATDDPVDDVENSLVYYAALKRAGVPVEMHLFLQGGHAFGLRPTTQPITHWPELVETWLMGLGVLPSEAHQ